MNRTLGYRIHVGTQLLVVSACFMFSGCAGFSRQLRASTSGIAIQYEVPKESLPTLDSTIGVLIKDERLDNELIGAGARNSFGKKVLGYLTFGLTFMPFSGDPSFQETDLAGLFQKAFYGRLGLNGVKIVENAAQADAVLEISLRNVRLDFNFGKWWGEVGYVLQLKKGTELIGEDRVSKKVSKFNMWGYGSGETAISEAFSSAVNESNLSGLLSRLRERESKGQ